MDQIDKAKSLLLVVQKLKAREIEGEALIEEGLSLSNLPPEIYTKFYEAKCLFYFRNAKSDEWPSLYAEFSDFLKENPQLLTSMIEVERFQMLFLYNQGHKEESVQVGDAIIKRFSRLANEEVEVKLCDIYWITGGLATNVGQYEKCTQYFNKALALCEKHDLKQLRISIYAALGDIYRNNNETEKAVEYLKLGINNSKEIGVTNVTASMLSNLGLIYQNQNKQQLAEDAFQEALSLSQEINHPRTEAVVLLKLAEFYAKNKRIDDFYAIFKSINQNAIIAQLKHFQTDLLAIQSEVCIVENKLDKALDLASKYEKIRSSEKGLHDMMAAYKLKLKILKAQKKHEDAIEYYEKLLEIKEQILNEKNKKHLQEFEMKFQNERKEKEIQALKLESVSFQLQSLRAQMNPHFVFNTIASISQDLHPESISKSKKLLESFARLMRANLDFAEEEKITLEDEIKFLHDYLTLEQNRLGDRLSFTIDFDKDLDLDFIEIPSMLIQPYIENAVKHGIMPLEGKGEIKVSFKEQNDQLICTIEDNGIGRKAAENRKNKRSTHIGKSTTLNAKRLELLSPKMKENLKVIFTDKLDNTGKAEGTIVEIIL